MNSFISCFSCIAHHKSKLRPFFQQFAQMPCCLFNFQFFQSKMIDFSRTFCDLHPNELISNFCCKEECNVGLCATCICTHTETHIQKRTAPDYENIRATYSKMQDSIRARISAFEQEKSRVNLIIETIQAKRKQIAEAVLQARHDTLDFVNRFYDTKEKELLRKVEADEKKAGLHNENRMESLLNIISRDVNTLFASAQDLNSQTFLESFHRIRTQVLGNSLQTQREIAGELDKNEAYETNISISPAYISDIKSALERSISVVFGEKKPKTEARQVIKSSRTTLNNNNNEGSTLTVVPRRSESVTKSSMILQPRYTQTALEPYSHFLVKEQSQPQLQSQMMVKRESFMPNNSVQIATHQPSYSQNFSRIELRPNSSEKNIKENLPMRTSTQLPQNFMESSFGINSNYDHTKKIKKSGLTIFKAAEYEQKTQS